MVVGTPAPGMSPSTKDPGNERIRKRQTNPEILSTQPFQKKIQKYFKIKKNNEKKSDKSDFFQWRSTILDDNCSTTYYNRPKKPLDETSETFQHLKKN